MDINTCNINVHIRTKALARLFSSYVYMTLNSDPFKALDVYVDNTSTTMDNPLTRHQVNHLLDNNSTADEDILIYPPTSSEITEAQHRHKMFSKSLKDKLFKGKDSKISPKVIDDIRVLPYEKKRLVIPTAKMQSKVILWYHHYLQHPGTIRLEETIAAVMYWKGTRSQIRRHVKTCDICQLAKRHKRKYGHLPPKFSTATPWKQVCVNLIGPSTIKAKDKTVLDYMCLTMIDPAI